MKQTHTYHQLLVDYIEGIGTTERAEPMPPLLSPETISSGWKAVYRIRPVDQKWELSISQFCQCDHLFTEVMRVRFPSKVVADIMGRYHCRRINQEHQQNKPSNSSPQLLN